MNETVNKFLLGGGKCMAEINLRQPGFTHSACGRFAKRKGRIHDIFIKTNQINLVFNMTWLMEILKI